MPRQDGTGPRGGGGGQGQGGGRGMGGGRGNRGGLFGAGPGGQCVCPSCGTAAPHTRGEPCAAKACPKCGAMMVRE